MNIEYFNPQSNLSYMGGFAILLAFPIFKPTNILSIVFIIIIALIMFGTGIFEGYSRIQDSSKINKKKVKK